MSDRLLPHLAVGLPALPRPAWHALARVMAHAWQAVMTRRDLRDLDPHLLADIGVSRAEAAREAARAPWDLDPPRRSGSR